MPIFSHKSKLNTQYCLLLVKPPSVQNLFHKSGTVQFNELPCILFMNLVFKLKVRVNTFLMSQQSHLEKSN